MQERPNSVALTAALSPSPPLNPAREALDLISHLVDAMELTPLVAVHCMDQAHNVRFWNDSCGLLYGVPGTGALGHPLGRLFTFDDQVGHDAMLESVWRDGVPSPARDWRVRTADGRELWIYSMMFPLTHEGSVHQVFCMDVDVTARKVAECKLQLAAQVFEHSRDAIVLMDARHRIVAVNSKYAQWTGLAPDSMPGLDFNVIQAGFEDAAFSHQLWRDVASGGHWQGDIAARRLDGEPFAGWLALTAIRDSSDQVTHYMGILSDISDRKKTEGQTRHLAEHDYLTDLPNRVLALDRLTQALSAARSSHAMLALLFIDIDHFKVVNDTLGHAAGDALLKELAVRLVGCVRGADTVSRQGGDEFLIIFPDVGGIGQAAHVADMVLQALAQPYEIAGNTLQISASIGVSIYPDDGGNIDELTAHADLAMYHAKESGRNNFQFFDAGMQAQHSARAGMEKQLQQALARGEFLLEYQAECDIGSGQPVGMDALLRWRHPERGVLLPDQFMAAAEQAGLMVKLGEWALHEACKAAQRWRAAGHELVVAVNLSAGQFAHKALPAMVADALAASGLPPALLELELTEEILMKGRANGNGAPAGAIALPTAASSTAALATATPTATTLQALHALGVRLTIDDFGTGYTRLGVLKDYPIAKLKIDRSFTMAADGAVITTIIAMARSLNLQVIAEGVETDEQLAYLRSQGCDQYQGRLADRQVQGSALGRLLH